MAPPSKTSKACLAFGFGTVAGYVDVVCLIRFSAFGTMMTGNLLMIAKSIMDPPLHADAPVPTPLFFSMIVITRGVGLGLHYMFDKSKFGVAMALTPLLLAMTVASEVTSYMQYLPYAERWIVCIVSMIFGVQSAVTHPTIGVPTILATGHMTNMFYIFLESILQQPDADLWRALLPGCVVCGMTSGALIGAFAIHVLKETALLDLSLTPIMILQGTLVIIVECLWKRDVAATKDGTESASLQLAASSTEARFEAQEYSKLATEAPLDKTNAPASKNLGGGERIFVKLAAA